ncbi:transposase [Motilimonas sp. E26]|uniref:REP-associated tyrosine transposase n=1 Tax=Motilimonas sp. E26 TaxID=2865674 RepID=UPI001E2E7379|nr:transposase [Motilimonas sp. E26]MCE0557345.1 transposase [Motilimonas sp. E26]
MNYHANHLRFGRVSQANQAYSLTSTTFQRRPIFHSFSSARLLINSMAKADHERLCSTLAFVVMPDHFHWVIQLADLSTLSQLVGRVKREISYLLHQRGLCRGSIWQHGFYDHAIRNENDLLPICRYVVANPLRAGLVKSVKDYPYWDCVYL